MVNTSPWLESNIFHNIWRCRQDQYFIFTIYGILDQKNLRVKGLFGKKISESRSGPDLHTMEDHHRSNSSKLCRMNKNGHSADPRKEPCRLSLFCDDIKNPQYQLQVPTEGTSRACIFTSYEEAPTMSTLSPCSSGGDEIDTMSNTERLSYRSWPRHRHMLSCESHWRLGPPAQWTLLSRTLTKWTRTPGEDGGHSHEHRKTMFDI